MSVQQSLLGGVGWMEKSSELSRWTFGAVCRELQPGSSSLLHSCEVAEHVEKIQDREETSYLWVGSWFWVP